MSLKVFPIDSKKPKEKPTPAEGVITVHRVTNALLDACEERYPGSKDRILSRGAIGRKPRS